MATARFRRSVFAVPAIIAATALVACGSDSNNEVIEEVIETTTETTETSTEDTAAEAPAGEVELSAAPTENLSEGDLITVDLAGLVPSYGYYVGICSTERPEGSPAPICTGDRSGETQAWLAENGTVQIPDNGQVTLDLTAVPTAEGEDIDCRTQQCVLKVFGDHTEGFEDVVEVPVTFAA